MYQRPGVPATGSTPRPLNPGAATDYSDERPHIFTHYFVGANAGVPAMYGSDEKSKMAVERLQNAAEIKLDLQNINNEKLGVSVFNNGAGHSIPTGLGDLRQVWLELVVKDKDDQIIFSSGMLDKNNELAADILDFKTVLGDENGNPVINVSKARHILSDTRIKAGQTITRSIDIGRVPEKGTKISVRLLYRSAPQKILKQIPGEPFEPLPVIEMARDEVLL